MAGSAELWLLAWLFHTKSSHSATPSTGRLRSSIPADCEETPFSSSDLRLPVLDTQAVTQMEVHEVFSHPPISVALEHPDGHLHCGSSNATPSAAQYVSPAHSAYVPPSGQHMQTNAIGASAPDPERGTPG